MNLTELNIGQTARIVEVSDTEFKEKLQEMGCVAGVLIKPVFKAPFGDPVAYDIEEYTLSMRNQEAKSIVVNPLNSIFNS